MTDPIPPLIAALTQRAKDCKAKGMKHLPCNGQEFNEASRYFWDGPEGSWESRQSHCVVIEGLVLTWGKWEGNKWIPNP